MRKARGTRVVEQVHAEPLRRTKQKMTLTPSLLVAEVRKRLHTAGNALRAEGARAYFKTNEKLSFYGIDAARLRVIERDLCGGQWKEWVVSDAIEFCDILIRDVHLEAKTVGMLTLARYGKSFEPSLLRRIERWLGGNHCANWATTDELSSRVIAPLIRKWPKLGGNVEHWTSSRNLWLRRAAAVSFVPCARRGECLDAAYRIATTLLGDREDLIHKATGWLLRESGKTDPVRLERYLLRHGPDVPRTTLRYAIERFPPARRRRVLVSTRPR